METPDENILRQQAMTNQRNIMHKAASFAKSMASRGVTNKKVIPETKTLRQLSCHGDDNLIPCSNRKESDKFPNSFYCGACGCGDKQGTQLIDLTVDGKENYGKLDYPKVWCPLDMPGFQPYKPSSQEPIEMQNSRKKEIENRMSVEYITEKSKGESIQ
jgi:hypothetical protein